MRQHASLRLADPLQAHIGGYRLLRIAGEPAAFESWHVVNAGVVPVHLELLVDTARLSVRLCINLGVECDPGTKTSLTVPLLNVATGTPIAALVDQLAGIWFSHESSVN